MNILIVGLGEVGSYLGKVLSNDGNRVTVVDPDLARVRRVADSLDLTAVQGDGSRPDVLDRADAGNADLLLAVSNDDRVNMLTCLFGKRMGAKKTVLRLRDTSAVRRSKTFFRKNLQYDVLLSLEDLAASEVLKSVRMGKSLGVSDFAEGKVQMRRFRLGDESRFVGAQLKALKWPQDVLVAAIDRNREVVIPGGDDDLRAGDEILVIGEPRALEAMEKRELGVSTQRARSVVVLAGSPVSVQVAQQLQREGVAVRIVAEDRSEAERLSEQLKGVVVLHADATDNGFLLEERIGDADAYLGLSEEDERNLISCQLARSNGCQRTVALVQKPDYVGLYEKLGIDVAVSPRLLCANRILSYARSRSICGMATIEEGQAEVLEVEIPSGSALVGKTLREAGFPRGCVIAALSREDGSVVIPRGEDELRALDNMVVFALHQVVDEVLELVGVVRE